jgi:hypothetical protein
MVNGDETLSISLWMQSKKAGWFIAIRPLNFKQLATDPR